MIALKASVVSIRKRHSVGCSSLRTISHPYESMSVFLQSCRGMLELEPTKKLSTPATSCHVHSSGGVESIDEVPRLAPIN